MPSIKEIEEKFDEKFGSKIKGQAMPSGTETAGKIKKFYRSQLSLTLKEVEESISWLTRYERSKFRANLSEAEEEGTVPMLTEKEVLQIIHSYQERKDE